MLNAWDFAIGDVRVDLDLRWRRIDGRIGSARDSSHAGQRGDFRNVCVIGNIGHLRNAGNVGFVGNVRLRLDRHGFIVDVDLADSSGRQPSNRNSAGIDRDRKSRGQFRNWGTDHQRIAPSVYGGTGHHLRYRNVNSSGRLTNNCIREREQP